MKTKHKSLVVLPTYNGERYLVDQIQSILKQEDVNVRLIVLDDFSNDKTIQILEKFRKSNIKYYKSHNNRGTLKSLMELVKHVETGEYLAFADQDDIWSSRHLINAIETLQRLDTEAFNLYFPRYAFIDRQNNLIANRKSRKKIGLRNALIENPAIGCGIVLNPTGATYIKNFTFIEELHMDNQLYFIASLLGTVAQGGYIGVQYRLHDKNQIGIGNIKCGERGFGDIVSDLRRRQHALEKLYLQLRPFVDLKRRYIVETHFSSLKKNGFERLPYSMFPIFRREKLRDQLVIQIICGLGFMF